MHSFDALTTHCFQSINISAVQNTLTKSVWTTEWSFTNCKINKAVGIDNIANEALKHAGVMQLMYALFNHIFDYGCIPSLWRKAVIHPIPKGKNKEVRPLLYRGLSLQSCIYKLYSSILNARLMDYLDNHNHLAEEQNGFRKNRSCAQHIYTLNEVLHMRMNKNKTTHLCFIDFQKAFDYVDRNLMLSRLVELGITGKFYAAMKETYNETLNAVRLNNELGCWFCTDKGLKQGDNLAPTIFSVFINGLIRNLDKSGLGVKVGNMTISSLAYADDIVLVAPTQASLQQMINITHQWCHKWRMQVNITKTKTMHVRKPRVPGTTYNFVYNGSPLESVENYRYLGYWLNCNLEVKTMVENTTKASERALGGIIGKIKKNGDVGFLTFDTLYKTCVVPVMDYCSGIWGLHKKDQRKMHSLDKVQERALRFYIGLDRKTPIAGLNGDYPLLSGTSRRVISGARFYNSILSMPETRLPRRIFEIARKDDGVTWAKSIHDMLRDVDLEGEFDVNRPIDIKLVND